MATETSCPREVVCGQLLEKRVCFYLSLSLLVVYIIVFDTSAKARAGTFRSIISLHSISLRSISLRSILSLHSPPRLAIHSTPLRSALLALLALLRFAPFRSWLPRANVKYDYIHYSAPLRSLTLLAPFKLISNPPFYTISYYSNSRTFTLHSRDTFNIIQITTLLIKCR